MNSTLDIPLGDYVSAELQIVIPDICFPNMVVGDKANNPWPYLRRQIGHNWYCDRRAPQAGFVNRDEAVLLYNLALPFKGKPALEIGCWMGWSTCHLALAGLVLDTIDPVLGVSENVTSVRQSLMAAGVLGSVRLYAASSPEGVKQIAELTGTRWNFFFIDGDHGASAPERDARECLQYAADDAMIVFHDLVSPDVERGLDVLRRDGWEVLLYQTMQIMGVAWRGNVQPVTHTPDPAVIWNLPLHLAKYRVSGASIEEEVSRLAQRLAASDNEITQFKSDNRCLQAEMAAREGTISRLQAELTSRIAAMGQLDSEVSRLAQRLAASDTLGALSHNWKSLAEASTSLLFSPEPHVLHGQIRDCGARQRKCTINRC